MRGCNLKMPPRKSFSPYKASDIEIFHYYNKKFRLPRCYDKQRAVRKKCSCFRDALITYNPANPLMYVCKMIKTLKEFNREFEKHENLIIIQAGEGQGCSDTSALIDLIKYHAQTIEYFGQFLKNYCSNIQAGFSDSKTPCMRALSRAMDFVANQASKCSEQLTQTYKFKKKSVSKIYQDLALFSHIHTLIMFKRFLVSFNV